nr:unnamed protein product [Callosobruchus chinensis]
MEKTEEVELKSKIFYFFREKHWNQMLIASKEGILKFKGNPCFHLYQSLSLVLINRLEEGVHELEALRNENDIKLSVTIALMYGHKVLGVTNREIFTKLDAQMREYRKSTEAVDFYYSAFVLLCFGKPEKALDYADKALNIQSSLYECLSLKGWILIQLRGVKKCDSVKELFHTALQHNANYMDAILGYTECCLMQNDTAEALNSINKAVVRHNNTSLPLLQKLRVHLASFDWEQALETANRINNTDSKNLTVHQTLIMISLCRSSSTEELIIQMKKFFKLVESIELNNVEFLLDSVKLFTRISDRNFEVYSETVKALENCLHANPEKADLVVELGYEMLFQSKMKEALRFFKNATKIEETSFNALLGLSMCEFSENGNSEQLRKQIEFLMELKESSTSPLLMLIQAKISENPEDAVRRLKSICDIKLSQLKGVPFSGQFLLTLDPDLMLDVAREYLKYATVAMNMVKGANDSIQEILNIMVKSCPGSSDTSFVLAKLQYLKGDDLNALRRLEILLSNTSEANSDAQLLMAQIQVKHGQFDRAKQTLETCVSNDFKIRDNPVYHYIVSLVEKNSRNYPDAIKSLNTALALSKKGNVGLADIAGIYVELLDALHLTQRTEEADKLLEEASEELKGTPEEARILLLSAEHLIKRDNVQAALDLLDKVSPTDSCFTEARAKHADIMLNYRRDKKAFLKCHEKFAEENPSVDSYVALGDAYMTVLEPDLALKSYEKALNLNPSDPVLIAKMGKALVDTHYFKRAVNYYKEAIKTSNDPELKLQLAELHMNLREYEKGELILLNELEEEKSNTDKSDLTYLRFRTKLLILLGQIQEKSGNITFALKSLKDGMENQQRVRKRVAIEQSDVPENEIQIIVDISVKLGDMAMSLKHNEQAINYYKEGLDVSPNNVAILTALAKLYMQMNYMELCQQTCGQILRIDPDNETASVIMADIAFRKIDFDMALFHFTQLVAKQPKNWEALARLIEILRRTGNIDDAPKYLEASETYHESSSRDPGFLYCKGLYQWYCGNLNGALRSFNGARNHVEFGLSAIYNMIEICLNPDDEMLTEQFVETDDIEYKDSRSMALKTADRLLKELKQKIDTNSDEILKYRLLTNFRLLATKEKFNIDRALDDFVVLASESAYKDNIAITLGIATAYTLLKQSQRAKNQLKRIVKSTWTFEDAEYLERCWLLLGDYYIQSSKYDIAMDLINKVIQHNKSCTKAYEYCGYVSEKEQKYKDAANYYEKAWKYSGRNNPSLGFKLAYCLMKSKKFPDAIDAAQEVLRLSPEYPRVRKDILDKCMNNLRV